MTYTILSTEQIEETIFTEVEFDFDGVKVECKIPHFMPGSKQEVLNGIENRMISEKRKLDAINLNRQIINELE